MDKKRIFLIIGFLAVSALMAYAIYFVFFRKTPPPTTVSMEKQAEGGSNAFPSAGEGKPLPIETEPVNLPINATNKISAVPTAPATAPELITGNFTFDRVTTIVDAPVKGVSTAGGTTKFYNSEDGKFYKIDANGTVVSLDDQTFYNVQNVAWSPKNNESIIQYPDGSNIYYNFDTKKQVTLPKHWDEFSFSALGDQIAAKSIGNAPENRWLITAAPDGTGVRLIEPMGANADKVILDWSPNRQVVALSKTGEPLGDDRQQVLLVGLNKENFRGLVVEGRGLETKWSKQGTKLLHSVYSAASDFKPELWIVDATPDSVGGNRKLLNVKTWASKCVMADERFVYCGVPEQLDTGAGFAPKIADQTPDMLYKIDTTTGIKTQISTEKNYTVDTISVSDDGQALYITDKNKPGAFKINL